MNEIKTILSLEEFNTVTSKSDAVCIYLSTQECNVCKVLKPKVYQMLKDEFEKIDFYYVDLNQSREIAGQLSVFSVPTILIYFTGKETIRASRNIHLEDLKDQIERYYKMIF